MLLVRVVLPFEVAHNVYRDPEDERDYRDRVPPERHTDDELRQLDEEYVDEKVQSRLLRDQQLTDRVRQHRDDRTNDDEGTRRVVEHQVREEYDEHRRQGENRNKVNYLVWGE